MATDDSCETCGFQWDAVSAPEIPRRIKTATDSFVDVLLKAGPSADKRSAPERWSILEYGSHVRDVLISIRERIITASILDEPTGAAIHRDERVALGFSRLDAPAEVAGELSAISNLFVRTFASLPTGFESREFYFSPVTPAKVTILWAGAQALHECEHHLADVEENFERLSPGRGR